MTDRDPIYLSRLRLHQQQDALPPRIKDALSQTRARAVSRAAQKQQHRPMFRFTSRPQRWGMGLSLASVMTVLISLQAVREISRDIDIGRIAAIDQKMMTDRLPVQAYLDPGFLVFQEGAAAASDSASDAKGQASDAVPVVSRATSAMREFWSLDSLFPGTMAGQTPLWSKLTVAQREALAPLEAHWPEMENERRRKWIKIADRFHLMTPDQQALAQERMQEWVSLPATERRQARAAFDSLHQGMPEDVRVMKWNEYQKLSEQDRARLIELAQQRLSETDPQTTAKRPEGANPGTTASGGATSRPRSALAGQAEKPIAR